MHSSRRVPPPTPHAERIPVAKPTAGMGLLSHGKSGLLEKPVLRSAVPAGLLAAALAAWLSFSVDTELLRRPFGIYLLAAGAYTLLQKPTKP